MIRIAIIIVVIGSFVSGCVTSYPNVDRPTAGIFLDDPSFEEEFTRSGGSISRVVSSEGIKLLKEFEGEKLCAGASDERKHCAYNDSSKFCTIGHGHLIKKAACEDIEPLLAELGFVGGISDAQAEDILRKDLTKAQRALEGYTLHRTNENHPGLSEHQYDALVSFIFNVGGGNYSASTLLKRLNARESIEGNPDIAYQFRRWNKSKGQFVQGLLNRRDKEVEHFFRGYGVPASAGATRSGGRGRYDSIDIGVGEASDG